MLYLAGVKGVDGRGPGGRRGGRVIWYAGVLMVVLSGRGGGVEGRELGGGGTRRGEGGARGGAAGFGGPGSVDGGGRGVAVEGGWGRRG